MNVVGPEYRTPAWTTRSGTSGNGIWNGRIPGSPRARPIHETGPDYAVRSLRAQGLAGMLRFGEPWMADDPGPRERVLFGSDPSPAPPVVNLCSTPPGFLLRGARPRYPLPCPLPRLPCP